MRKKNGAPRSAKSTKDVSEILSNDDFQPSEYMRARRPELFSDSTSNPGIFLTREVFEYHLDTLTNRKQEIVFEHFCRRIAEREICPNLLPQTGPTGGGDSKTDSETYPVAETIALRWYEAVDPIAAAAERWAFAFSAKKKWRPKCHSDIDGIVKTGRGHTNIYFFTNQFVKDKERSTLEDQMSTRHGAKVHIMDRSWILKCVFEHDRIELAVETLNLDQTNSRPRKQLGPRDVENRARLETLEKEIDDPARYEGSDYQLVEDCLHAALIARNLELPRLDIEGRFERAERIARRGGHAQQLLRVAYNRSWTSFWWYDNLDQFLEHYTEVEDLATKSSSADALQLLTNLWQLLHSSCARRRIDAQTCSLEQHTLRLTNALTELANDKERKNKSLQARTELTFMRLAMQASSGEDVGAALKDLRTIIKDAKGMISYPFEPIPKIIEELGDFLTDIPEYDELLEEAVTVAQERSSQQQAGRMLLARGFQKLRAGRIYEAIVYFGRAQRLLAMRESRWEISEALFACGKAYEAAGLLWAARANILASANQVLSDYWEEGFVVPQAMVCAQNLAWIEIQLGRPACVMEWMRVADAIASSARLDDEAREKFRKVRFTQEAMLGMLFLRARQEELRYIQFMPDVLEGLDLEVSRMAVLYALGHEEKLRTEGAIPVSETGENVRTFFIKWLDQPSGEDLPERLVGVTGKMTFISRVLGCNLRVLVDDENKSIFLAERLLAALEALLSTSLDKHAYSYREDYLVQIERSNKVKGPPEMELDIEGGSAIVRHAGELAITENGPSDWFILIVAQLVSQIVTTGDFENYLHRVMGSELGLWRAVNFTETSTPISNILGAQPKFRISDWNVEGEPAAHIVRRVVPWHEGILPAKNGEPFHMPAPGTGDPPKELFDRSSLKHSDRRVSSIINVPLWDKAKWGGVIYIWSSDPDEEPAICLGFADGTAGRAIFRELRDKLGPTDDQNRLRVSIITGVDKANPSKYSVVIGSNLPALEEKSDAREIISWSRIHHMDNSNPENISMFQSRFSRSKRYAILPAQMPSEDSSGQTFGDLAIWKESIRISPAWQIGENDLDAAAIGLGDDPIIPGDAADPPVLRLIERRKRRQL